MARVLVSREEERRWRQGMGGSSDWVKAEEAAAAIDLTGRRGQVELLRGGDVR
jgi:hypothetical protein